MASAGKPYNPELFDRTVGGAPDTDITLLDLFAAYAMNGLYASGHVVQQQPTYDKVAHTAYEMAEAMLIEREKRLGTK